MTTSLLGCPLKYLLFNFAIGGARLHTNHRTFLDDTLLQILGTPEQRVRLIGRASRSGGERRNLKLSRQRAEAVKRFLQGQNVAESQITVEALGENAPLSTEREAGDDRSVEIRIEVNPKFTIALNKIGLVRNTDTLVQVVRSAFEPLVKRAGRKLTFVRTHVSTQQGDMALHFQRSGHETKPCGVLFFGNEGGGDIWVGAHKDLRVCGGPRRVGRGPEGIDYVSQIVRVFEPDEPEFARFVGNTVVHELGHMLAQLPHVSGRDNYMYSVESIGANLPKQLRTRETMRRHWAGPKVFDDNQKQKLICAIQTGNYRGGMRIRNRP